MQYSLRKFIRQFDFSLPPPQAWEHETDAVAASNDASMPDVAVDDVSERTQVQSQLPGVTSPDSLKSLRHDSVWLRQGCAL